MIFRNWILENFPFLEDDFDALTDYKLFCKMMEYVKQFAKDNEEFKVKLADLQNQIDNLDIEDAVNAKLDEMVTDGTLADLINQEIFGELNTKVNNAIQTEIDDYNSLVKFNNYTNKPLKYGKLNYPTEFSDIPFNIYRANDRKIYDDVDLSKYDSNNIYYVDYDNGNDTTHTNDTFKTIKGALTYVNTLSGGSYKIICKTYRFCRGELSGENATNEEYVMNNSIIIEPYDLTKKILISPEQRGLSWTQSGTLWTTTRAGVNGVFNLQKQNGFGMYEQLTKVESLSDCENTNKSWYLSGSTLYVHTENNEEPTFNTYMVRVGVKTGIFNLNGNHFLRLKNIDFYPGAHIGFKNSDTTNFENCAIMENVRIYTTLDNNGFSFDNIKNVYTLECCTGENNRDGFNYHYTDMTGSPLASSFVYERNCTSYNNGLTDENNNNNCSTIHEGGRIIRVNNVYQNSRGPIIADIGSPKVLMINCNVTQEMSGSSYRYAYRFENETGNTNGIAYLIDCTSNQYMELSLYGSENFKIRLKNFNGNYENDDLDIQLYNE